MSETHNYEGWDGTPLVWGQRKDFPSRRPGVNRKFWVPHGGVGFILISKFGDQTIGEIFIKHDNEGSEWTDNAEVVAKVISLALQYGCPIKALVKALREFKENELAGTVAMVLSEEDAVTFPPPLDSGNVDRV